MFRDLELTAEFLVLIAVAVPLILLWAAVFIDLFRRKDLSVIKKALWATLVIFSVHIGVVIYFIFRPVRPPEGKRLRHREDRSSAIVTEIEQLHKSHEVHAISDDDYLKAKRELLGLAAQPT